MDSRASVSGTTWLARNLNRSVVSQSFVILLQISCIIALTGVLLFGSTTSRSSATLLGWNCGYSFTSNIMCGVLYAISPELFPTKWDGKRTRGSCESYLWDHGAESADYRPLHELGDTGAYLCFCLSVCGVRFHCIVVAIRAAWEGVIVDTQQILRHI
jgi:hypothetical protein